MLRNLLPLLIIVASCSHYREVTPKPSVAETSSNDSEEQIDYSILRSESVEINGQRFSAILRADEELYVYNKNREPILFVKDSSQSFLFKDFDKDGLSDLVIEDSPSESISVYLFDQGTQKFTKLEYSGMITASQKIQHTKYFFSYFSTGCADNTWVSELFYIDHFKVHPVGRIVGDECYMKDSSQTGSGDMYDEKRHNVKVIRIRHGVATELMTIPAKKLDEWKHGKFGFIEDYWRKNHSLYGGE